MRFLKFIIIVLFCIFISSCALFSTSEYKIINPNTTEVARHNLQVLKLAGAFSQPYLLVDRTGKTSLRDLYIFINETQAPLARSKEVISSLIKYNEAVIASMNKNKEDSDNG